MRWISDLVQSDPDHMVFTSSLSSYLSSRYLLHYDMNLFSPRSRGRVKNTLIRNMVWKKKGTNNKKFILTITVSNSNIPIP